MNTWIETILKEQLEENTVKQAAREEQIKQAQTFLKLLPDGLVEPSITFDYEKAQTEICWQTTLDRKLIITLATPHHGVNDITVLAAIFTPNKDRDLVNSTPRNRTYYVCEDLECPSEVIEYLKENYGCSRQVLEALQAFSEQAKLANKVLFDRAVQLSTLVPRNIQQPQIYLVGNLGGVDHLKLQWVAECGSVKKLCTIDVCAEGFFARAETEVGHLNALGGDWTHDFVKRFKFEELNKGSLDPELYGYLAEHFTEAPEPEYVIRDEVFDRALNKLRDKQAEIDDQRDAVNAATYETHLGRLYRLAAEIKEQFNLSKEQPAKVAVDTFEFYIKVVDDLMQAAQLLPGLLELGMPDIKTEVDFWPRCPAPELRTCVELHWYVQSRATPGHNCLKLGLYRDGIKFDFDIIDGFNETYYFEPPANGQPLDAKQKDAFNRLKKLLDRLIKQQGKKESK